MMILDRAPGRTRELPTLRQLEYFVAIDDHRSFRAAARSCGVTQPGLSQQLAQLEGLLGVRLFERSRRRVLRTPAGDALAVRARAVLQAAADLADAASAHALPLHGPLRLGVIPTIAPYWLPRALPRVRARFPELKLLLREAQTAVLVAALERGELDLLLVALEAPLGDVRTHALFEDPFVAALPATHRLASRESLHETDLAGEPVLLLDDGHCLRDQALSVCQQAGAAEWGDFRATSLGTLVQMVQGGMGLTLLPSMAVPVEAGGLVVRSFSTPAPLRTIGLAWRATSSRAEEFRLLGEALGVAPEGAGDHGDRGDPSMLC